VRGSIAVPTRFAIAREPVFVTRIYLMMVFLPSLVPFRILKTGKGFPSEEEKNPQVAVTETILWLVV